MDRHVLRDWEETLNKFIDEKIRCLKQRQGYFFCFRVTWLLNNQPPHNKSECTVIIITKSTLYNKGEYLLTIVLCYIQPLGSFTTPLGSFTTFLAIL